MDLRPPRSTGNRAKSTGSHHKQPQKIYFNRLGPSGREFESPISDQLRNSQHRSVSCPKGGKLHSVGNSFAFGRNPLRWVFGRGGRGTISKMIIRTALSKWVVCSDLSFSLRIFCFNTDLDAAAKRTVPCLSAAGDRSLSSSTQSKNSTLSSSPRASLIYVMEPFSYRLYTPR